MSLFQKLDRLIKIGYNVTRELLSIKLVDVTLEPPQALMSSYKPKPRDPADKARPAHANPPVATPAAIAAPPNKIPHAPKTCDAQPAKEPPFTWFISSSLNFLIMKDF